MADHKRVLWYMGQRIERLVGVEYWQWSMDGKTWTFDLGECVLYLTRGEERKRVCSAECLKLAVGFSIGVHEAMGLRQETRLMQVIGG